METLPCSRRRKKGRKKVNEIYLQIHLGPEPALGDALTIGFTRLERLPLSADFIKPAFRPEVRRDLLIWGKVSSPERRGRRKIEFLQTPLKPLLVPALVSSPSQ